MNHYLVERNKFGAVTAIKVFEGRDYHRACRAYSATERNGTDCCLFSTDSLGTLCKTHGAFLGEPLPSIDELVQGVLAETSEGAGFVPPAASGEAQPTPPPAPSGDRPTVEEWLATDEGRAALDAAIAEAVVGPKGRL